MSRPHAKGRQAEFLAVNSPGPFVRPIRPPRRSVESDFQVGVTEGVVEVRFAPTRSLYLFARFTTDHPLAKHEP
jgi:hypothetical protein